MLCSQAVLVKLGPCGAGRHQGESQRIEAQGDELQEDERAGSAAGGGGGGGVAAPRQEVDKEEDRRYGKDKRGDELPGELAFREGWLEKIRGP